MPTFRKKSVTVEAWHNYAGDPVIDGAPGLASPTPVWFDAASSAGQVVPGPNGSLLILTLEGQMRANVGDWIIQGIKGELYPCKPDIFAATYEPAAEPHLAKRVDFGLALCALKAGKRVRRVGWNGMWLALTEGSTIDVGQSDTPSSVRGAARAYANAEPVDHIRICAHIDMRATDGTLVIGWLASQTDMLATDWEIV